MPPSSPTSTVASIHLLRALLREATYLPDASARSFFRRYIVARFKTYHPSNHGSSSSISDPASPAADILRRAASKRTRRDAVIHGRTRAMQQKARKGLNYLQRANQGEWPCLEKVLLVAYGRIGPRRYTLLDPLLLPDPASNPHDVVSSPDELSPLQRHYYSDKRFLKFFSAPTTVSDTHVQIDLLPQYSRLSAVLKSQHRAGISRGRPIKSVNIRRPMYNIWERAMPVKRARNDVRRWYAETIDRLLPPLPSEEWTTLRALAAGDDKWTGIVARRTPAQSLVPDTEDDLVRSELRLEQGVHSDKPSKAVRPAGRYRPHRITAKMMKRMYARVLSLSCKLDWNLSRNQWMATWGSRNDRLSRIYSNPVDDALFAGVDTTGRSIRTANAPQRAV